MKTIRETVLYGETHFPAPVLPADTLLVQFDVQHVQGAEHLLGTGCAWADGENLQLSVFAAEEGACISQEEREILGAFCETAGHFSGLCFFESMDYVNHILETAARRCAMSEALSSLSRMSVRSLLEVLAPYRKLLQVSGTDRRAWEQYLGLPALQQYHPAQRPAADLVLLAASTSLLAVDELFTVPVLTDAQAVHSLDYEGRETSDFIMTLSLSDPLPRPVSVLRHEVFLHAHERAAILKLPVYGEHLHYYYEEIQDYWYFPAEDRAIHKSLAQFSDRTHREKATIDTAYTTIPVSAVQTWSRQTLEDYCRNVLHHLLK